MIFGDPYDAGNGAVVIAVSRTTWPARSAHPVGIFTVRADGTTWTPVADADRIALVGVCTGFVAALIGTLAVLRRPPWPEMTERTMVALAHARIAEGRHRRSEA